MIKFSPLILLLILLLASATGSARAERETVLLMPPDSLAQWYKPINKRQVWLHTMFRLRREMQAVEEYARQADAAGTRKWGTRLAKSYRQIPEMVPEWRDEVRLEWADRLEEAAIEGDFQRVLRARKKLENSCNACHRDFRPLVAALYRAPDFSGMTMTLQGREISYHKLMEQLSRATNRIKIAIEDQRPQVAMRALKQLKAQLKALGTSCSQCHQERIPKERILGAANQALLEELQKRIQDRQPGQAGRLLGKAAVAICARCHGVHRTLGDLRQFLTPVPF